MNNYCSWLNFIGIYRCSKDDSASTTTAATSKTEGPLAKKHAGDASSVAIERKKKLDKDKKKTLKRL